MGSDFDIREYKKELRLRFKAVRTGMTAEEKQLSDEKIFQRIIASSAYNSTDMILTYVSTAIEVDTIKLINQALADGKRVAVPRCISGTRLMDFYFITSMDDLETGTFSVLEPVEEKCEKAYDVDSALCIIPGLSFDMNGFRLGYGGGYYDRFLSAHPYMHRMGICYCSCTVQKLISGRFDTPVNTLVTEKYLKKMKNAVGR
ncbi:MAG: 5-formyltetrahydrofolate cyclo-ligase [Oscillospiraceae bacterium]|nr:5-formyltetrahydrofolate cyclo-ligase [Oscillospiraceae bacterium]